MIVTIVDSSNKVLAQIGWSGSMGRLPVKGDQILYEKNTQSTALGVKPEKAIGEVIKVMIDTVRMSVVVKVSPS